ncbi:zinc finger TRAF-type-containing protein 1 isoform X2 [Amblyomma americanum]
MADETGSSVSGSELAESTSDECLGEAEGPAKKRFKAGERLLGKSDKLEHRLGGILCCAVCLDLPRSAIYQCTNGHLMCAGCFTHLLADARLRDETATCPNCRTVISRELCSRNLAVEKAVCELPTECVFCGSELPRAQIERHEAELCEERLTRCQYSRIGCQWRGPYHELEVHSQVCSHPHKSGGEVMEALELIDQQMLKEQMLYNTIFELLSVEKITFNDLWESTTWCSRAPSETSRSIHACTSMNSQKLPWRARINRCHCPILLNATSCLLPKPSTSASSCFTWTSETMCRCLESDML